MDFVHRPGRSAIPFDPFNSIDQWITFYVIEKILEKMVYPSFKNLVENTIQAVWGWRLSLFLQKKEEMQDYRCAVGWTRERKDMLPFTNGDLIVKISPYARKINATYHAPVKNNPKQIVIKMLQADARTLPFLLRRRIVILYWRTTVQGYQLAAA